MFAQMEIFFKSTHIIPENSSSIFGRLIPCGVHTCYGKFVIGWKSCQKLVLVIELFVHSYTKQSNFKE